MTQETHTLVLLSGGVDSTTVAYMVRDALARCLFLDWGQPAVTEERAAARTVALALAVPLDEIVVPTTAHAMHAGVGAAGPRVVPARNLLFAAVGVHVAAVHGLRRVALGPNADDFADYPDCRPDFVAALSATAQIGAGVEVVAPLVSMSKAEVVARARALGVPLAACWTCYQPVDWPISRAPMRRACGTCNACRLRAKAGA